MKIRLALVDKDENYVKRLINNLQLDYADKIEPYYFSSYENFQEFSKTSMVNVVLVSEEIKVDEEKIPERCSFAYLVSGKDIEEVYGKPAVCKFQKAELLYKNVLSLFADTDEMVLRGGNTGTRNIMFTSAQGGVGVSALAMAYAMGKAKAGKKVFFLSIDNFFKTEMVFKGEGSMTFSDVMYAIKSKKANLSIKLESAMKQDASGVHFFDASRNANDMMELNVDDLDALLGALCSMGGYEYVVIDTPLNLGSMCRHLLTKGASEVILVNDGSEAGNVKFQRAMEVIKLLDQQQKGAVIPKCRLVYNRFSSSNSQKLVDIPIDTVGGINRIEGAQYKQLVEKLSTHQVIEDIG